jgi:flavin reductase (DIM6/NTAB) family NADH-FMN oxidoreductase RutF
VAKQTLSPQTILAPLPSALISCGGKEGTINIITLAWVGVVNSDPPMISISIRPSRFSHPLIAETGEFVANIPTADMVEIADGCGMVSGREGDKFAQYGLTPELGTLEYAPYIEECPLNVECRVKQIISLGSHDLFLAEVVNILVDEAMINENGHYDPGDFKLLGFSGNHYLAARKIGSKMGFSRKKEDR